ncbi:beta-propeller fold lactonase family protein [Roseivivax isoporae]|uniref:YNCE-like beta-propeller domain-containing protein n=1 Tax=Roseivivax isoporae LMG 25204 TaxID=1449351 RepID=X7F9X1_9RHOB|nr:beta-propeller fold lactonase family protein [Roseivivax isoporae]ETX29580.1 hypothetical protein RISW2_22100 [Roseivivax isoporae LMG 25204]
MRRGRDLLLLIPFLAVTQAAGDTAYVTNQNGGTLSVVDLDSRETLGEVPLPGEPAGIAVTPDALFTVSAGSTAVRRLDPVTFATVAETLLDGGPTGIAADAARGRVFVSDWYNARIWVLSAADLSPVTELATGAAPAGLALSPDGRWLAAAVRDGDAVALFDAATLEPHATATVGTRPFGLRFAPDGRLFVGNVGSNDVTIVDPVSAETRATVPVGDRPYGVAFAGGRAFVTNQYANTVSVIDLDRLEVTATLDVGEYPEGVDATSDGAMIVVANWFDNSVSLIDAATLDVSGAIAVGDGPRAFGTFVLGGGTE